MSRLAFPVWMYYAPKYGRFGFFLVQGKSSQFTERNMKTCHRRKKYLMSIGWEMITAGKDRESKDFIAWSKILAVRSLVLVGCLSAAVWGGIWGQQIWAHNTWREGTEVFDVAMLTSQDLAQYYTEHLPFLFSLSWFSSNFPFACWFDLFCFLGN